MATRLGLLALSLLTIFPVGRISLPAAAADNVAPPHDCAGSPPDAVTALPSPLSKWGEIVCTPYGQMLASHKGWMWIMPDLEPVLVPAQLSDTGPDPVGNRIYFTKIDVARVKGQEFDQAYTTFHNGFDSQEVRPDGYRVDLTTVEGKSLRMYFFDYDTYAWGMLCPENKCQTDTRFMILDRSTPPKPRQPSI